MKNTPKRSLQIVLSIICGILSLFIDFFLIPKFMMLGIHDALWSILMIVLPVIPAIILLGLIWRCKPVYVFWGLPVQLLIAAVFCTPIGKILGFHLESFAWDFFDFIAYAIYIIGWSVGATLAQFLTLWVIQKIRKM